jgi:hypothetical protein
LMTTPVRAEIFRYLSLDVTASTLTGHYALDDETFTETVTFEHAGDLTADGPTALAQLWFFIAGLSYFKAGAARQIDLGQTPLGNAGRALFEAALHDGLGEFSFRNDLPLDDVIVSTHVDATMARVAVKPDQLITPFGGGIDSVVTVASLSPTIDQALFVVSPVSGRFAPLEETAAVTGLPIVRATRQLDLKILGRNPQYFNGHVPVTTMVTMLAAIASLSLGRGGVAMSNEHSSSAPNLRWHDRDINHQWSKSLLAEELIGAAIAERIGDDFVVASFLRNRSEVWVAKQFASLTDYHRVFRSCNRAFNQLANERALTWCGECDKCLFINLVLAPFIPRDTLQEIFSSEPLANLALRAQLESLVGIGHDHKPFECVGDPDESAVALTFVANDPAWDDCPHLKEIASIASPDRSFTELLEPQGLSRVPAHWLR